MHRSSLARSLSVPLVFALLIAGCGSGGGSGGAIGSSPDTGLYAGSVMDSQGPVAGATVSIQGVEAEALTDSQGNFVIEDEALAGAENLDIAVVREGYEPVVQSLAVEEGQRVELDMFRRPHEPALTITAPNGERAFVIPADCDDPQVLVEGFATLGLPDSYRLDVVIVIDRSGSTGKDAFDVDGDLSVDSVLDVEVEAARCFLDGLDFSVTRACIVEFNDSATVIEDFTSDDTDLLLALNDVDTSSGGTNYEAAFAKVQDLFLDLEAQDAIDEELPDADSDPLPTPWRVTLFLSDGIPTSHGVPRDMSDTNLTQSSDDRQGAIDAAELLGTTTGTELHAFSVLPAEDTNKRRTTLPQCVAACGGGQYENVPDLEDLEAAVCGGDALEPSLRVTITQESMGLDPVEATLYGDGFFSEPIAVDLDAAGAYAGSDGNSTINEITVKLEAFSGSLARSTEETLSVRLIHEDDADLLTDSEQEGTQFADEAVVDAGEIRTPRGGELGDTALFDLLTSEYEDAVEIVGGETYRVVDPTGGSASSATLTVDFVFKEACYESDFGYIIIDPDDPPATAWDALSLVPNTQVLFNSGDLGGACNLGSIAAGTAQYSVTVTTDTVVVFFIVPNRTLDDYQANPRGGLRPLFTLSSLNPGGFDQVLSFRSLEGRTVAGADDTVVTSGPLTVFAFEDLTIARRRSDQDFSDVVFTVSAAVVGNLDSVICD